MPPPALVAPAPVLHSINPSEVEAKNLGFTLTVHGERFTDSSVVWVDGVPRETRFVSTTTLTAPVAPADRAVAAELPVIVVTPPPGGGVSDTLLLTVLAPLDTAAPALAPILSYTIPAMALTGSGGFRLTVRGENFLPRTVVRWNGADRATRFYKSSRIFATISPADVAQAGAASLSVATRAPGGGLSEPVPIAVVPAGGAHPQAWNVGAVPVADEPRHATVAPDGTAYASRPGTDSIIAVDPVTAANLGSFPAGSRPGEIVFDAAGTTLYVAGRRHVAVIALATRALVATHVLPATPVRLRLDAAGAKLFVATDSARLEVLDAASGATLGGAALTGAGYGMAFAPDGSRLWVTTSGRLSEFSSTSYAMTRTLTLEGAPRDVVVTADGSTLFVANEAGWVSAIDPATLEQTDIALPGAFGLALTPDGTQLWVTQPALGLVSVIATDTWQVIGRVYVTGTPRSISFTSDGQAVVVANGVGLVQIIR